MNFLVKGKRVHKGKLLRSNRASAKKTRQHGLATVSNHPRLCLYASIQTNPCMLIYRMV